MKEITVIGEVVHADKLKGVLYEKAGLLYTGATRIGEIYMTDVKSMVTRVVAQADGDKITRLNILDHGNKDGGQFGKDRITVDNFETFAPFLGKLFPVFEKSAVVHLQHCEMGQNTALMQMFAAVFGVAVYAGTGAHNAVYRFNWGDYVRCSPSGTIYNNVQRP
jgi:hypothetical protein